MNFLKDRFYSFVDDRLQLLSLLGFAGMALLSALNLYEECSPEWILRTAIYGLGVFLVFFFSHRGTWVTWFIVANVLFYFSHYRNVSYFAIVTILICLYPMFRYPLLGLYFVHVFMISHLHNLDLMKVCFHLGCCLFVYFSIQEICRRVKNLTEKQLELSEDEKMILDYLLKGVSQNDIPEFSPQTVSRKLRAGKIRNGVSSTKELKEKYGRELKIAVEFHTQNT